MKAALEKIPNRHARAHERHISKWELSAWEPSAIVRAGGSHAPVIQRWPVCPCDGGCPRCRETLQPKQLNTHVIRAQSTPRARGMLQLQQPPVPASTAAPTPAAKVPSVDCTAGQSGELTRAFPIAIFMVEKALRILGRPPDPKVSALLRKYFNDAGVSTQLHVRAGYLNLIAGLRSSFKFECEQKGSLMYDHFCGGIYAYVRPYVGFRVHLCDLAFGRSATDLAETIVHECSHMFDNTDDEAYCWGGCPNTLDRWDAYDNADSFSKFVWEVYTALP